MGVLHKTGARRLRSPTVCEASHAPKGYQQLDRNDMQTRRAPGAAGNRPSGRLCMQNRAGTSNLKHSRGPLPAGASAVRTRKHIDWYWSADTENRGCALHALVARVRCSLLACRSMCHSLVDRLGAQLLRCPRLGGAAQRPPAMLPLALVHPPALASSASPAQRLALWLASTRPNF